MCTHARISVQVCGPAPAFADRDGAAGEFAEALRDQFMAEHTAYYVELEEALMEKTGFEADCTREQLAAALVQLNPDLPEKQARCCRLMLQLATAA